MSPRTALAAVDVYVRPKPGSPATAAVCHPGLVQDGFCGFRIGRQPFVVGTGALNYLNRVSAHEHVGEPWDRPDVVDPPTTVLQCGCGGEENIAPSGEYIAERPACLREIRNECPRESGFSPRICEDRSGCGSSSPYPRRMG